MSWPGHRALLDSLRRRTARLCGACRSSRKEAAVTSDFGFNGTRRVPPPVNEPVKSLRPRLAREGRAQGPARRRWPAERIDIPLVIGGQGGPRRGETGEGGDAARPRPRARRLAQGRAGARRRRRSRPRRAARREWASWPWEDRAAVFLKAAELLATTWRADAQRGHHARPVEDRLPGRDRLGGRARRLLALQPALRAGALRRAAALDQRDVEPARLPAARGLRLRGDALQLHVDRRQPAHGARPHGQHRGLEAGLRARSRAPTAS